MGGNMESKTIIHLCSVTGYPMFDPDVLYAKIMKQIREIRHVCMYKFPLPLPIGLRETRATTKTDKKTWFGKVIVVDVAWYHYELIFDRVLTEEELNLWRMFKMGWRTGESK